ncbi:MAG: polyphosphate kinase 1, partial [Enterococcus italicus]
MQDSPYTSRDYFHRDLSWLLFNKRVIQEAKDEKNPLIERLRFLAIASNNADEFFMIRVPGIQSLARMSGEKVDSRTGWTQEEILEKLFAIQTENVSEQYTLYQSLLSNLANMGYETVAYQELSDTAKEKMTAYFQEMILPSLTPIALDAYHAFPKIVEKKAHLLVRVKDGDREERAIIPLPALFPRYIQVEGMKQVILIEDLIEQHLAQLFVGWKIVHSFVFRITYDKDLAFEEDTEENLFIQMEEYIQERSKGLPSRLEISELQDRQSVDIAFLTHMLELKDRDIYSIPGPLDLTYLFSYLEELSKEGIDAVFPVFRPYVNQQWLGTKLYETLDKQDVLIQHPYDSYESVVSFIETAARDPHTIAIKQTLYRMAKNSRIVEALKSAARAGKQVTALVELKARFDEENNLHWVQELEEAGCYVTYGLMHLKTHSKATLVVKKNGNQLQQYVHIGTGNYNESTAKIYTDFSLFSSHTSYVEDVTAFFNYLSGYRER